MFSIFVSALLEESPDSEGTPTFFQILKSSLFSKGTDQQPFKENFTQEHIHQFLKENKRMSSCLNAAAVFLVMIVAFLTGFYH